jgi:hypothetical protein
MNGLPLIMILAFLVTACSDKSVSNSEAFARNYQTPEGACIEPSNPYNDGGGHDAGFIWAEEKGEECTGNADSFDEGCEEYYTQRRRYEECEAAKRK